MKVRSEREFSFAGKADTLRPGLDVGRDLMTMLKTRRAAAALLCAGLLAGVGPATGGASAAPAKTDQTIVVSFHAPSAGTYATAFTVAANAVPSGLPVSFSASGACSNVGGMFTMTTATGTCLVKFDQAGDATYDPAPQVVESVTAQKANQTIVFNPLEDVTFGDLDFDIAGALASSDLPVTLTASGSCAISGVTVHLTAAGSCTITATQAGDANYNAAAPVPQTLTIAKGEQEITFLALPDRAFGDPDFRVKATADSGLPVSFTASERCTVLSAKVHLLAPGSCKVTASQNGNADYRPALSVSQSFKIARPVCSVPNVTGKRLRAAKQAISQSHCRTGTVTYANSTKTPTGRVSSQSRKPGRRYAANTKVDLVVSLGKQ
jgi:PASTA domain